MFRTLRWRIAASYALLLAAVIVALGALIAWRFQSVLYEQARTRVNATMGEIVAAGRPGTSLFGGSATNSLETLINSNNLASWSSPTTYVQVNSSDGSLLNKSSNLGSQQFTANPLLGPKTPGPLFRVVRLPSGPFLVEDQYLQLDSRTGVVVHVAESLGALQRTFSQLQRTLIVILLGTILAVVLLSFLLASQITEPVNHLARTMRQIGSDQLQNRVAIRQRSDEIGQLAASFDDLIARLGEAFARERQFISDASHELKTPLTSINSNAQMLLRWADRDETVRRESLETIVEESGTLAGVVGGMLTLAKADRGDDVPREPLSLTAVAQQAVKAALPRAQEKGLDLRFASSADALVLGDEDLLRQLVGNLIDNAIKFTQQGRIDVTAGKDGERAWVTVADTGPGIPESEIALIFDRFYRADKSRTRTVSGTGLGLAIVRSIARVHGGTVTAARAPSGGALFSVSLPLLADTFTQSS